MMWTRKRQRDNQTDRWTDRYTTKPSVFLSSLTNIISVYLMLRFTYVYMYVYVCASAGVPRDLSGVIACWQYLHLCVREKYYNANSLHIRPL